MANRIVSVHTGIYGMGIYAIMLPSSGFSVAYMTITVSCPLPFKGRSFHMTIDYYTGKLKTKQIWIESCL